MLQYEQGEWFLAQLSLTIHFDFASIECVMEIFVFAVPFLFVFHFQFCWNARSHQASIVLHAICISASHMAYIKSTAKSLRTCMHKILYSHGVHWVYTLTVGPPAEPEVHYTHTILFAVEFLVRALQSQISFTNYIFTTLFLLLYG